MYPAVSEADILGLPFPKVAEKTMAAITKALKGSREMRQAAYQLLQRAKRAVEIAVEDSEKAGLRYLENVGE